MKALTAKLRLQYLLWLLLAQHFVHTSSMSWNRWWLQHYIGVTHGGQVGQWPFHFLLSRVSMVYWQTCFTGTVRILIDTRTQMIKHAWSSQNSGCLADTQWSTALCLSLCCCLYQNRRLKSGIIITVMETICSSTAGRGRDQKLWPCPVSSPHPRPNLLPLPHCVLAMFVWSFHNFSQCTCCICAACMQVFIMWIL